jgi:hypothetical protein
MGAIIFLLFMLFCIGIVYPAIMWVRWRLFFSKKISLKEYWQDV